MKDDDRKQVNPRILKWLVEILDQMARERRIGRNEMSARILEEYLTLYRNKMSDGNVYMLSRVLHLIFSIEKEEDYEPNAKEAANLILSKMKRQVLVLDPKEVKKRLEEWHRLNRFEVNRIYHEGKITYKINHKMGYKFSKFQTFVYREILRQIGIQLICSDYDEFGYEMTILDPDL